MMNEKSFTTAILQISSRASYSQIAYSPRVRRRRIRHERGMCTQVAAGNFAFSKVCVDIKDSMVVTNLILDLRMPIEHSHRLMRPIHRDQPALVWYRGTTTLQPCLARLAMAPLLLFTAPWCTVFLPVTSSQTRALSILHAHVPICAARLPSRRDPEHVIAPASPSQHRPALQLSLLVRLDALTVQVPVPAHPSTSLLPTLLHQIIGCSCSCRC